MNTTATVLKFPDIKKEHDDEYRYHLGRSEYYSDLIKEFESYNSTSTDALFAGMHTIFGAHSKEVRDLFIAFWNSPSSDTWSRIRNYLINPHTTAWQLWIQYDKNAPFGLNTEEKKLMFPDPVKFEEYYRKHKEKYIFELKEKLSESKEILSKYK